MFRTLQDIRRSASLRERDLWTGLTSGDIGVGELQLDASRRQEQRGFFANGYIQLDVDDDAEHLRIVDNLAGGLSLAQPGPENVHASGTQYEIHKICSAEDINTFIIDAVRDIGAEAILANQSDESLAITANTAKWTGLENEYEIPEGFRYITEVRVENRQGAFEECIPLDRIRILPGRLLHIERDALDRYCYVGAGLRLLGQGEQDLSTIVDGDLIMADSSFIIEYVRLQLMGLRAQGSGQAADTARLRYTAQLQVIEAKRDGAVHEGRVLPGSLVVPL